MENSKQGKIQISGCADLWQGTADEHAAPYRALGSRGELRVSHQQLTQHFGGSGLSATGCICSTAIPAQLMGVVRGETCQVSCGTWTPWDKSLIIFNDVGVGGGRGGHVVPAVTEHLKLGTSRSICTEIAD